MYKYIININIISGCKSNVIPLSGFEKSLKAKDKQIAKISQKYLNLQHEFNKYKKL